MSIFAQHPDTRLVYLVEAGSHAYGTNTPTSDHDERGIVVPPLRHYLGLNRWEQDVTQADGVDRTIFSLQRAVNLALGCNPNMIELFFVRPESVIRGMDFYEEVKGIRHAMLSKQAHKTFGGYAIGQLYRLTHHKSEHGQHGGLVEKYGYDTKNALHLVRLFRMGCELLETGEVNVYRSDAEELLSIRNGAWTFAQLLGEAEVYRKRMDVALEKSPLPAHPNRKLVEEWVYEYTRKVAAA